MLTTRPTRFRSVSLRLCSVLALWTAGAPGAQGASERPNFIVILADDLGAETLGSYGGTSYRAPELDRLAAEGMRFVNGHSQPLCTPTRVKIMTGLHNYRNYREFAHLEAGEVTFAHVLSQAGYDTAIAGKWQLANNGFVVHEGTYPQQAGFDEHRLWQVRRESRGSRYWGPTLVTNGKAETYPEDEFGPDIVNDFVLDYIDRHAVPGSDPFLVYYPMVLPHDPFVTTPHDPDAETDQEKFGAMVSYMDFLVGRVREKLAETGLDRSTLVLFIGDNGTSRRITSRMGSRQIRGGKGSSLQTGTHVPFVAWWPGMIPRGVNRSLVDVGDVFPTLVEAAAADLPASLKLDGSSLLQVLRENRILARDGLFIHYEPRWAIGPPVRYAFDERWKLDDQGRLYDLERDRTEQSPIPLGSAPPEARASVARLQELLDSKSGSFNAVGAWRSSEPRAQARRHRPPFYKPNILLFIADDMTYGDAGALGNREVSTPNLDRLAERGTTFTHVFTASPMCSPTRHMLFNGRYPVRSGAYPNHAVARAETRSMAHYLRAFGYRVGLAGKSHIAPPDAYPFERVGGRELDYERIQEFMAFDERQPFALIVASTEPHLPWDRGDPSRYDPEQLTLPPYFVDTPETRRALAHYYAEISYMDGQLGLVLDRLDENGQSDNTLIMFYSEQGIGAPFAKWTLYDAGVRGSVIAKWRARVPAGERSSALIQINDLLPTWIELAGGWPVVEIEGRSFAHLLLDPTRAHRDRVYGIQTTTGIHAAREPYPIRSIRTVRYKLIWNLAPENRFTNLVTEHGNGGFFESWKARAASDPGAADLVAKYQTRPELELYDLEADPHELDDLSGDPVHRDLVSGLRGELEEWMAQQGDLGLETELDAPNHQVPRVRASRVQ